MSQYQDNPILGQYQEVLELYRHEDGIIWRKVTVLLTANAALGTLLGFAVEHRPQPAFVLVVAAVVGTVGILVTLFFRRALVSSEQFLRQYRGLACELERVLVEEHAAAPALVKYGAFASGESTPTMRSVKNHLPQTIVALWVLLMAVAIGWSVF